ncbi:MAG: flagellar basal body P-ring formation chaperone FlgA [bacterium]
MRTFLAAMLVFFAACTVEAGKDRLPESVRNAVQKWLETQWGKGQVEFEIATHPRSLTGAENANVTIEGDSSPRGLVILYVELNENGKRIRRVPLSVRVHPQVLVPVAKRSLKRGEILRNDMIGWERRDVTDVRGDWPLHTDPLASGLYRMRRTVRENDVMTEESIEKTPEVISGEPITLVAMQGNVSIATTGIAMEDGRKGDWIRVENPQYKMILRAQVTDLAKAVVGFSATRGTR